MTETRPVPPEQLLEHVHWVRDLARHLVADPNAADDLAQEACVAALERPPIATSDPRRWLAGVLRNLVRERARGEGRRVEREQAAARTERIEGTDELVARAQVQRELVVAVLELEEPYRSAVLLRWFEGLPPAAIAARLGVPVATVHSRQQRALALLRVRLDRAHGGDRGAWSALVLPLSFPTVPPPLPAAPVSAPLAAAGAAPSIGAVLMNVKLIAAAVVIAAAGAAVLVWNRSGERALEPREAHAAPALATPGAREGAPRPGGVAPAEERKAAAGAEVARPADAALPAATPGRWTVRGRVLDGDAQPRTGLRLKVPESAEPVASESYGRFAFETAADSGTLVIDDPHWVTVRNGLWSRGSTLEPLVIAAPAVALAGRVVDADGRPLASARVVFELPDDFGARFATILEATQPRGWIATCDGEGAFAFERVPALAGARLRAVLEGYAPASIEAPQADTRGLELALAHPTVPLAGAVRGRVVDGAGRPIEGARVALGLASAATSAQGEFAFDLARAVTSERIVAVCAGMQPAQLERPGEPGPGVTGWPDFVELRLGAPSLSITGRVVDAAGEPVRGAKLWIADPTPFGVIGAMPAVLENLMAGAAVPPQAFEMEQAEVDADSFRDWVMPAGAPSALWNWVATDADGRFEIGGLSDRSYTLRVLLEKPLCIEESGPIAAGSRDAVVRLDGIELFAVLKGRVVSDRGAPVAGVRVQAHMTVLDAKARVFGGTNQVVLIQRGPSVATDADGRFELTNLPRKGAKLALGAEGIVPAEFAITPKLDPDSFTITVHQRCHLQVELLPPLDRADEIAVVDGEGEPLDLLVISGNSVNAYTSMPLADGRSEVVSASSEARTLLLLKDRKEVERVPIDLLPGEVNRIRR